MKTVAIKFCGIRRLEDITYCNACMPDYAGFVFTQSKRCVSPVQAAALAQKLHPQIGRVGVFVNTPIAQILQTAKTVGLTILQLHGEETAEYLMQLRQKTNCQLWKAVRVQTALDIQNADLLPVDKLLLDSFCASAYGGSGKTANWTLIAENRPTKPFFLAGGLTAENASQAIATTKPYGIDLSSGIETAGCKDKQKMEQLIQVITQSTQNRGAGRYE